MNTLQFGRSVDRQPVTRDGYHLQTDRSNVGPVQRSTQWNLRRVGWDLWHLAPSPGQHAPSQYLLEGREGKLILDIISISCISWNTQTEIMKTTTRYVIEIQWNSLIYVLHCLWRDLKKLPLQVRTWVLFARQLQTIAEDMRLQFSHRLHVQNTAGLHRVVNAILRQGTLLKEH